jgi:PAS domain S-box-containing protein
MPGAEEDIYKRHFDIMPTMMGTLTFDARFLAHNPAWERQLGYSAPELDARSYLDLIHPEDRQLAEETLRKVKEGDSDARFDARFACKDGSYKWVNTRAAADREKNVLHIICVDITARKAAETALSESEALLRRIIDKAPMAMAIVAMDGTIEYINNKAVETFGFPHSDIPNMDRWWVQAYPDAAYRKEVTDRYMGHVYEALEKGGEIKGEQYLVTCKDGSKKTCFIFGVIAGGKVFVMFEDISERVRVEKTLRDSENSLRRILDQIPMAIAIQDTAGNIEYTNAKFTQTFGYAHKDIPTLDAWTQKAYPDPAYRAKLVAHWGELFKKAAASNNEIDGGAYSVTCSDGSLKTTYIFGVLIGGKAVIMLDDITRRVEAEKELRESESRYRALVETTRTGYVILGKDGRVLDANTEYVRLTGRRDLKEVIGRSVLDWTAEYEKQKNADAVAQCASDGYIFNFEVDYIGPSGAVTPIEVNATVMTRDGAPQILSLCRDISARRKTEAEIRGLNQNLENRVLERTTELTKANEELKAQIAQRVEAEQAKDKLQTQLLQSQKLEAVGRLAGGIAHDFNNILVSISGYAELLIDTMPQGAPARGDLSEILLETERGAALTRQLLTFSARQEPKLETVDLNAVATGSQKMLKRLIGANMHLETSLAESLYPVKADPTQLSQVIINLVINSRDAMPDGGKIRLETRNADLGPEAAGFKLAAKPGAYAELTVSDTGAGMSPETMEHLFEPFYTTKKPGQGTGLGLSTVYGIVSRVSGGIYVESAPDRGTTFKIYLPKTV